MPLTTQNLRLPYLAPAQAQKHVTHNEALRALDAVVQLSLISLTQTAPPANPAEGVRYFVAAGASGDWSGQDGKLAARQDGAWMFYQIQPGWQAWDEATQSLKVWDGMNWQDAGAGDTLQNMNMIGINSAADATNRLTVSSDTVVFNHNGNGIQAKLNKNISTDTASFLFQNAWSGRAEIGLSGDDDFHFKVSANGFDWMDALTIDKDNGDIFFGERSTFSQSLVRLDFLERDSLTNLATRIDNSNFGGAWTLYRNGTAQIKLHATAPYEFNLQNVASHDFIVHGVTDNLFFIDAGKSCVGINTASPKTTLDVNGPIRMAGYSVAGLPSAATHGAGAIIYVSNESGGAVLAYSDGTDWRRVTDRAVVS